MAALWRWMVRMVGLVILVIVGLGLYLTLHLNPNEYRAEIEQLAAEQGVPLSLNGNLSWAFWPNLGLSLEQVSLGASQAPILTAERMSARVAVAPLWQQQVVIESILLDGAVVNLTRNTQGQTNWELSAIATDSPIGATTQSSELKGEANGELDEDVNGASSDASSVLSDMSLQIAEVTLADLSVNYHDQLNDQAFQLREMQMVLQDFELTGQPFHWQQTSQLQLADKPPLDISSQGRASVDLAAQQLQLFDAVVSLSANQAALDVTVKGRVDLETSDLDLYAGIAPFNLQQWLTQWQITLPSMAAADALNHVGGSAHIVADSKVTKAEDISLVLDRGQWLGHAAMSESEGVTLVLNADQLDLDRYLPMEPPAKSASSVKSSKASSAPPNRSPSIAGSAQADSSERVVPELPNTPLPLEAMRDLNVKVALGIGQLTAKTLPFEDVVLRAQAKDGLLQFQRLAADQADGRLSVSGKLDTRRDQASLGLKAELTSIQINPLLNALAGESRLTGTVTAQLTLVGNGNSLRHWQQQAQGQLSATANALTINTLDIERSACELAALVNRKPEPALEWKNHTQFEQLTTELNLNGELLTFKRLNAEVENLRVDAKGQLDLRDGRFDVPMDVAFVGEADSERDCQVRDRWRNRDLPLRCEDRLANVSARSCGPDRDRLEDLLSDEVKAQAQDKLKEKLQEKLGKEGGDAVDQLLRGLFKRRD